MFKQLLAPRPDLGLLLIRLMVGVVFFFHGSQKVFGLFGGHGISGMAGWLESLGVPFPTLSAWLAGGTELLGGVALILGLGQRLISVPLTFTMLVAAWTHEGFAGPQGMEYPLTLALVAAGLGLAGPGRFALGGSKLSS